MPVATLVSYVGYVGSSSYLAQIIQADLIIFFGKVLDFTQILGKFRSKKLLYNNLNNITFTYELQSFEGVILKIVVLDIICRNGLSWY